MSTKDFLKNAKLDPSFFNRSSASEALPGFMELHGNRFLKKANTEEKKISVKNKTMAPKATVDIGSHILFSNEVFSKISAEIHSKLKEGESARLRVIANDRFSKDPSGQVTNNDMQEIYKSLGFTSKTACALKKIAKYSDNPEEYVGPEKRAEKERMAKDKKDNLIKTYVATSTSAKNPYNHGVANIGEIESKMAEYVKSKIAKGTFNFTPTIGMKTEDLDIDSGARIKNASSTATVSIPKHYNGEKLMVQVPMIIKEGRFIEPVVMAYGEEILPFEVNVIERLYWGK